MSTELQVKKKYQANIFFATSLATWSIPGLLIQELVLSTAHEGSIPEIKLAWIVILLSSFILGLLFIRQGLKALNGY